MSLKRPRDEDGAPKLKMEASVEDNGSPPSGASGSLLLPGTTAALLALPRSMRLLAHQMHLLDRRCRAALYDATRLTELYLLVTACPEHKDGTADFSSIPKAVASSLPPTLSEALVRIEANIRETERLVVRFAVQKRQMAEALVKAVDQRHNGCGGGR